MILPLNVICKVEMGEHFGTEGDLKKAIEEVMASFTEYHVVKCNCNHFADALCRKLLGQVMTIHREFRPCSTF